MGRLFRFGMAILILLCLWEQAAAGEGGDGTEQPDSDRSDTRLHSAIEQTTKSKNIESDNPSVPFGEGEDFSEKAIDSVFPKSEDTEEESTSEKTEKEEEDSPNSDSDVIDNANDLARMAAKASPEELQKIAQRATSEAVSDFQKLLGEKGTELPKEVRDKLNSLNQTLTEMRPQIDSNLGSKPPESKQPITSSSSNAIPPDTNEKPKTNFDQIQDQILQPPTFPPVEDGSQKTQSNGDTNENLGLNSNEGSDSITGQKPLEVLRADTNVAEEASEDNPSTKFDSNVQKETQTKKLGLQVPYFSKKPKYKQQLDAVFGISPQPPVSNTPEKKTNYITDNTLRTRNENLGKSQPTDSVAPQPTPPPKTGSLDQKTDSVVSLSKKPTPKSKKTPLPLVQKKIEAPKEPDSPTIDLTVDASDSGASYSNTLSKKQTPMNPIAEWQDDETEFIRIGTSGKLSSISPIFFGSTGNRPTRAPLSRELASPSRPIDWTMQDSEFVTSMGEWVVNWDKRSSNEDTPLNFEEASYRLPEEYSPSVGKSEKRINTKPTLSFPTRNSPRTGSQSDLKSFQKLLLQVPKIGGPQEKPSQ